ncbi:protein TolA [Halopseudomonas pachastrellae]|uniref:Protein TolA n=1 Tax=Halopseudomonas pachastrellae TaxID=254161 RepID=A0A1S8DEE9_9GAMM|nr:cell envelope integrity protein TolA [Halopseudomonas pachastrellae]ONM43763.1 protein TolA [Halopseudomonas pachastrellae]SFL76451.1 colicin import membrane protein [Halopseudomonas pachastrellae]
MSTRYQYRPAASERYSSPLLKAVGLHLLVAILLFASFSSAPEFEPARPIVQATLVQLDSMSPSTTPTDQKIAGEAQQSRSPRADEEALEKQREQQQAAEAARAAQAEQARQAEAEAQRKAAEAERQAEAEAEQKAADAAAAAERRQAEEARKAAEAQAARERAAAEAERKKAEEEARRKAQEEARRKAAEEAERKAAQEAERRREQERVAREQREREAAKASALNELLGEETEYQQAQADRIGDQVAASYDDVIRRYVSQQWRRPPTARNGMVVEVRLSMLPTGQITDAVVIRSSGDPGFDQSAVQAVKNVGRIPEMQQLSSENPAEFNRLYRQRNLRFRPEDLSF